MAMGDRRVEVVGQAWYTPESFRQLEEAIAAQGMARSMLCSSYAEFVTQFDVMTRGFAAKGFRVEKTLIDVPHMVAWCKRWGLELNSAGRTRYGAMLSLSGGDREKMDNKRFVDRTRMEH
jgi:hypothetical protein